MAETASENPLKPGLCRFTDRLGHTWTVAITVGHLGKFRRDLGLDFDKVLKDAQSLADFFTASPERLVSAIYLSVADEAERRKVTPEEFAGLFEGPHVEAATEALLEGVAGFFPRSRVASAIQASLRDALTAVDTAAVAKVGAAVADLKRSVGASPVTSASTPVT